MHVEQKRYCESIRDMFPNYFRNVRALDVGALDINGNNRYLFKESEYIGLDVAAGPNVDVVCVAHEYAPDKTFDTIISTNALEHDIHWKKTLAHILYLLRSDGLFVMCTPSTWEEHGTLRCKPHTSGTAQQSDMWANYYQNFTIEMAEQGLNPEQNFKEYFLDVIGKDLQFWGIKK